MGRKPPTRIASFFSCRPAGVGTLSTRPRRTCFLFSFSLERGFGFRGDAQGGLSGSGFNPLKIWFLDQRASAFLFKTAGSFPQLAHGQLPETLTGISFERAVNFVADGANHYR